MLCDDDDGEHGLSAPVDAKAQAQKVIGESRIANVTIDAVTNDLELTFDTGTVLQLVSNSSGYEAWNAEVVRPDAVTAQVDAIGGGGLGVSEFRLPTAES